MGLETVEILLCMESYFDVSVPDASAAAAITAADLEEVIVDLLVRDGMPRSEGLREEVWQGMMVVLRSNRIPTESIRPESKWVGEITKYG